MINNSKPIHEHAPWVAVGFGLILNEKRMICLTKSELELYNCNVSEGRRTKVYVELLASWCDSIRCRVLEWNRTKRFFEIAPQPFLNHTADEHGFIVISKQKKRKKSFFILESLKTQDLQMYALEIEFTVPGPQGFFLHSNWKVFGTVNGGNITLEQRTKEYMERDDYLDAMKFHNTQFIQNSHLVPEKKIRRKRSRPPPTERPQKRAKLEESKDLKPAISSIEILSLPLRMPDSIQTEPPCTEDPANAVFNVHFTPCTDNADSENLNNLEDFFRPMSPVTRCSDTSDDEEQESGQTTTNTDLKESRPVVHNSPSSTDILLSLFGDDENGQFSNDVPQFNSTMVD